jgi:hypothetical protein
MAMRVLATSLQLRGYSPSAPTHIRTSLGDPLQLIETVAQDSL